MAKKVRVHREVSGEVTPAPPKIVTQYWMRKGIVIDDELEWKQEHATSDTVKVKALYKDKILVSINKKGIYKEKLHGAWVYLIPFDEVKVPVREDYDKKAEDKINPAFVDDDYKNLLTII